MSWSLFDPLSWLVQALPFVAIGALLWRALPSRADRPTRFTGFFLAGFLLAFAILLLKLLLDLASFPDSGQFVLGRAFLLQALPEEALRALFLWAGLSRLAPSSVGRGWALGMILSLGLALVETLAYEVAAQKILIGRLFTAVPLHLLCGAILGMALAGDGRRRFFQALLAVVLWHGGYDFLARDGQPAFPVWVLLGLMALHTGVLAARNRSIGR